MTYGWLKLRCCRKLPKLCQGKIEMSYSQQSRNVLFCGAELRSEVKLDWMFRGSRAPGGRSEGRCDGAGSEADGAKPSVNPAMA